MHQLKYHLLLIVIGLLAFFYDPVGLGMMIKKMLDPLAILPMYIMAVRVFDLKKLIKWTLFLILPLVALSGYIQQLAQGEFSLTSIAGKIVSLYFLFTVFNLVYVIYKSNKGTKQ